MLVISGWTSKAFENFAQNMSQTNKLKITISDLFNLCKKHETGQSAQETSQHGCYSETLHASLTSLKKKK